MVLHNPNNWHWVNKDATPWAQNYLTENLTKISAEQDGVTAKISKLISTDGEVDVSQRKGKVITIFDIKVQLEYEGKTKDDEDVSGSITIPEVAHDTEEDEYVFDIDIYSESKEKQPVKDLVRSKVTPQLRKALSQLVPALITEHGKDIQHAPGENPGAGWRPPTTYPEKGSGAAKSSSTTSTSTNSKSSVNTTTVNASDEFRTTAEEMYQTFVDPQRIAAFTRAPPRVFEGAKPGAKFAIFDGNVSGEYVKLEEPTLIVQKWRLAQWPADHFSTLELKFDQNDVDRVTTMRVTWTGVPVGQEDVVKKNWEGYYIRSIKQTFGFGTIL